MGQAGNKVGRAFFSQESVRVKILHVVPSADPALGGVIEGVRLTCEVLRQTGHEAEIVCADDPASPWLSGFGFPVHAVGPSRFQYAYTPKLLPWLRENTARATTW